MARTLQVSKHFSLPLKFLSLRKVVFGGSGSGKTASGRTLFEEATEAGVLCGAVDLKGDWWGLKASADGTHEGIPIVIFGGDHGDVPLQEDSGAITAEIVVDLRQPFVIDLENFSKGKQLRFLGAFFDRLYDKNREPLVLFCDEADRYAPQKPMSPEANICLGAAEDIAKRGRKHGIFPVFISQRNASLNKGVTELCDVAIVFRTPGPRDQEAVEDWFSTKATREQRDEVMGKLAGLATGTAIMCSAHPDVKLFATVPMRLPRTFDSSATPEIGKRAIEPKRLAKPDLEKLKARMALTIAAAKAMDPKELRRELAEVRAELARVKKQPEAKTTSVKRVEVPAIPDKLAAKMERLASKMIHEATKHGKAMAMFWEEQEQCWQAVIAALRSVRAVQDETRSVRTLYDVGKKKVLDESLKLPPPFTPPPKVVPLPGRGGQALDQKILDALAWWEAAGHSFPTRQQVAFVAGRTIGGHFNNTVSRLHTSALISYPAANRLGLTRAGLAKVSEVRPPSTPEALVGMIQAMLGTDLKRRIFDILVDAGKPLTREEISEKLGRTIGGHFNNSVSRLSSLGIVSYPSPGMVGLSDLVNFA